MGATHSTVDSDSCGDGRGGPGAYSSDDGGHNRAPPPSPMRQRWARSAHRRDRPVELPPPPAVSPTRPHWGVICGGCGADPLRGDRHTCTKCRPRFDLCAACYGRGVHLGHPFILFHRPGEVWQRGSGADGVVVEPSPPRPGMRGNTPVPLRIVDTSRDDLNGRDVTVMVWEAGRGRREVVLPDGRRLAIRVENLEEK